MSNRTTRLTMLARAHCASDDPGHDFAHVTRVARSCERLARDLGLAGGVELTVAAALLHDLVNLPKDHPERAQASDRAASAAEPLLIEVGFAPDERMRVQSAIREHSFSRGERPTSLESAILQDADRLDALGAIGVMRTVSCGALMRASYYDMEEPFARTRPLDDRRFTIDHFFVKLFALEALMNTEPGRREAARRTAFLREFLAELEREL